ncbi:hypothetical protein [Variovorax sp. JS1663]|nr:hypothetical protein [Variovorax sp. JS1663]
MNQTQCRASIRSAIRVVIIREIGAYRAAKDALLIAQLRYHY